MRCIDKDMIIKHEIIDALKLIRYAAVENNTDFNIGYHFRKNSHKDPMIVNGAELKNMTTKSRVDHFSVAPPIGPSLEWLSEAIHQGFDKDILFVRFEDFTKDPEEEMKKIYLRLIK
jgi:hypothetical protein